MTGDILAETLRQIKPSAQEEERLKAVAREIVARLDAEAARMALDVYAVHVGSTARDTWLRGRKDIDIFLMFPPDTPRASLEQFGLLLAKSVSGAYEEKYAEHPYVRTSYESYEVDLVPCYRVPDPAHIQSAVDRSPFHNVFVLAHIDGLCDETRLLKQFMHGAGVYGSELRTRGFAGYLCELLVIKYGSFLEVVRNGAGFRKGMVIDLQSHIDPSVQHPEPLIVIDPVDPARNVAAALSEQKLCEFIDACRRFLEAPDRKLFFPPLVEPLDESQLLAKIGERDSLLLGITFVAPKIVEDTLYPQLYKAEESVVRLLEQHDFKVFSSGVWADTRRCAIVLEMLVEELPGIERHLGPPLEQRDHAGRFKAKYPDAYVYGCRYAVDLPRKYRTATELIREKLTSCALGKQVAESVKHEFIVLSGASLLNIGEDMGAYLKTFLR